MAIDPQPAPTASDAGQNSASAVPGSGPPAVGERTFTQAELEAAIKDRLERQRRALEADQAKAREATEAAALAEQGKYKELADKAHAELATIRPQAERAATLEALIAQHIDALLPRLPESLRALLPKGLPIDQQYAWVQEAERQAAALTKAPPAPAAAMGFRRLLLWLL